MFTTRPNSLSASTVVSGTITTRLLKRYFLCWETSLSSWRWSCHPDAMHLICIAYYECVGGSSLIRCSWMTYVSLDPDNLDAIRSLSTKFHILFCDELPDNIRTVVTTSFNAEEWSFLLEDDQRNDIRWQVDYSFYYAELSANMLWWHTHIYIGISLALSHIR